MDVLQYQLVIVGKSRADFVLPKYTIMSFRSYFQEIWTCRIEHRVVWCAGKMVQKMQAFLFQPFWRPDDAQNMVLHSASLARVGVVGQIFPLPF